MNSARASLLGLVFGALALILAIIPSYLLPVVYPTPALAAQALDTVDRLKDRAMAKLKGEQYRAAPSHRGERAGWYRAAALATAVCAVLAIIFGAVGYVRNELTRACATAIVFGVAALLLESLFGIAATWIMLD
jgi:hypothetical protein